MCVYIYMCFMYTVTAAHHIDKMEEYSFVQTQQNDKVMRHI
jgi:hypothetical protein